VVVVDMGAQSHDLMLVACVQNWRVEVSGRVVVVVVVVVMVMAVVVVVLAVVVVVEKLAAVK
jgi:hypothetical protein